ncbi:carboxymuconolactone decarboxylase family protein [Flindersiella endophytica]
MKSPASITTVMGEGTQAMWKAAGKTLGQQTLALVHLRASQINGCSFCVVSAGQHAGDDETERLRLFAVAAWREAPYFTDAERAALALTEAVTRIADRPDPVPDELWDEAAKHFSEEELAALLMAIGTVNVWNRLNVAVRQPAGQATWS